MKIKKNKNTSGRLGKLTRPGRIGKLRRVSRIGKLIRKKNGTKVTN